MQPHQFAVALLMLSLAMAASAQMPAPAPGFDAMAEHGAALAQGDREASRLRAQLPDDSARRGFDIGMAAAENDTLPGPGKQKTHDALPPGEQDGFAAAVDYLVRRNAMIEKGAALSRADAGAMALRDQLGDERAVAGFDMGMAAAETDTLPGPGKQKLHDSLDLAGQLGFAQAVTYSLQRNQDAAKANVGGNFAQGKRDHSELATLPGMRRTVPNVVGMSAQDARTLLGQQKFLYTETMDKDPDPSVQYGHVRASVPAAGQATVHNTVEIQVPRAASRIGKAALALSDYERRAGFDLDEGNYEDILRGADIVLRHHDHEKQFDDRGNAYYVGQGLFIEPSDGAVLVVLDGFQSGAGASGSYMGLLDCREHSRPASAVQIAVRTAQFCVRTAKGQTAYVEFRTTDNAVASPGNYQFRYAVYPRQARQSDPLERK